MITSLRCGFIMLYLPSIVTMMQLITTRRRLLFKNGTVGRWVVLRPELGSMVPHFVLHLLPLLLGHSPKLHSCKDQIIALHGFSTERSGKRIITCICPNMMRMNDWCCRTSTVVDLVKRFYNFQQHEWWNVRSRK